MIYRSWLYELCRGIDFEPVKARQLPKSIGCSKNFPGKTALATQKQVKKCRENSMWFGLARVEPIGIHFGKICIGLLIQKSKIIVPLLNSLIVAQTT